MPRVWVRDRIAVNAVQAQAQASSQPQLRPPTVPAKPAWQQPWVFAVGGAAIASVVLLLIFWGLGDGEPKSIGKRAVPQQEEIVAHGNVEVGRDEKVVAEDNKRTLQLQKWQSILEKGRQYLNRDDYDTGLACFNEAARLNLDLNPKALALGYSLRGLTYWGKGEYRQAIVDYSEAIRLSPTASNYHSRGMAYRNMEQYREAIKDSIRAIEIDSSLDGPYHVRGVSHYYRMNDRAAIEDLTRAIEIDPNNAHYYFVRSGGCAEKNDYEAAFSDLQKAVELSPTLAKYRYQIGTLHLKRQDYHQAEKSLSAAISLDPKDGHFYVKRGLTRLGVKKLELALDDANMAIELLPKGATPYTLCEARFTGTLVSFLKLLRIPKEPMNWNPSNNPAEPELCS